MPPGCTLDLELEAKDILAKLLPAGRLTFEQHYTRHVESHGARPTAGEMARAGLSLTAVRTKEGGWFDFVHLRGHLNPAEQRVLDTHRAWLRELEVTSLTKCFKMVVLEALLDADSFFEGMHLDTLADRCRERLLRDVTLRGEIEDVKALGDASGASSEAWRSYWRKNPVDAWLRGRWFMLVGDRLVPTLRRTPDVDDTLVAMTAELTDLRLTQYRKKHGAQPGEVTRV